MRDKLELTGIVLASTPVGDYDKRLVILTKERGKITAFARGARKPNSAYLGISEPFNYGLFTLSEGHDAYYLVGADIKEYFLEIKNDIEGICFGTYFCDVLEYLSVDGLGDVNMLNLLYITLKALTKKEISNSLIRRIFELKVLEFDGEAMVAFACPKCGTKDLVAFSLSANGLLCKTCSVNYDKKLFLTESTIYTIQYVLSTPLSKLYHFQVREDVMQEFDEVVQQYFAKYVTKKFNSLEILASLS